MLKRCLSLFLIVSLLLPSAAAFAQSDSPSQTAPSGPIVCSLVDWASDFGERLTRIETLDEVGAILSYLLESVATCAEQWISELVTLFFGFFMGTQSTFPPFPSPIDDGFLSAEDAETAIRAAFSADIFTANLYFCPEEQLDFDDVEDLPANAELQSLKCTRDGDRMICSIVLTENGLQVSGTDELVRFHIVDEKLCEVD